MSAAEPVTVLAYWTPVAGALDTLLALAARLRPLSLAEPGCLGYEAYRGADADGGILLVERYRDEAALAAHRQSGHYQELVVGRVLPLLADRRVEFLRGRDQA